MNQKDIDFDGHNDLLLRLWLAGDNGGNGFLQSTRVNGSDGHLDLKSTKEGNFSGGFFAIFSPSPGEILSTDKADTSKAKVAAEDMISIAKKMEQSNPSDFSIVLNWLIILISKL